MTQYPGVYEAKVVTATATSFTAAIPQLFRDTPVTVTKRIGSLPPTGTMGFVSFIGGDPAWPVWLGAAG